MNNVSLRAVAEEIKKYNEFVIYFHIHPDGDAVGSAYALMLGLRSMGCRANAVCADKLPKVYSDVESISTDEVVSPCVITVDTPSSARLGIYGSEHINICIDHHSTNNMAADMSYIEPEAAACTEIIYKLLTALAVPVTKQIAELVYTGLITDTLCFRSTKIGVQSFETAAQLAKSGADIFGITKRHFLSKSPAVLAMEQRLASRLNYLCGGEVVSAYIVPEDYEELGLKDDELETLNSVIKQIRGLKIGIVVRELERGSCRCSLISNGACDVSVLAAKLGGGGHKNAAGFSASGSAADVTAKAERLCACLLGDIVNDIKKCRLL